jgi:hypothetical protein
MQERTSVYGCLQYQNFSTCAPFLSVSFLYLIQTEYSLIVRCANGQRGRKIRKICSKGACQNIAPTLTLSPRIGQDENTLSAGLGISVAKSEGQVQVKVNAPPGWRTSPANKGALFREVKLNRGNAMQLASQDS